MKRLKLLLVLILTFTLTGCIQRYDVSEEQNNAVAEYMAGMILKYDRGYEEGLTPMEYIAEDGVTDGDISEDNFLDDYNSNKPNTSNSTVDSTKENVETGSNEDNTLTQVVGKSGFTVKYKDYKLVDTYPEDPVSEGFYLEYKEGYQYLVASFTLKNTTAKKNQINLIKSGITYELIMNDTKEYVPSLTLLENDLRYLDLSIAAGKSKNVLLIFKVSKETDIKNMNITATKDKKSVTIILR